MNESLENLSEEFNLDKDVIWSECLSFIKERIQEQAFQTWFDDI